MQRPGWLGLLLCIVLLQACGFQLRGYEEIPDSLKTVYFKANSNGAIVHASKRLLTTNGVTLVDDPQQAAYQLHILKESNERRAATLTSSATTREYELRSSLTFEVLDKQNKLVLEPTEIYVERVYSYDENNVTASDSQEGLLRREMQDNLAQQLLRRYMGLAKQSQTSKP